MLGHFTFQYQQIPTPDGARPHKPFVKFIWLRRRTAELIKVLRPICNKETNHANARCGVTLEEAREWMARLLAGPLLLFGPAVQQPVMPAPHSSAPVPPLTPDVINDQEDAETSIGETLFRQGLSSDGEMFIAEMMQDCPGGFSSFFADTVAQLRGRLNAGRQRRLLVMTLSGYGFQCKTLASVEARQAIGVDAEPCPPGETVMEASLWLDPAIYRPATLFAVLGASTQNLASLGPDLNISNSKWAFGAGVTW